MWNGFIFLRTGFSGRLFEDGNENSGSLNGKEILYQIGHYCVFKKDSVQWGW
jgi:hypothetical protein